MHRERVVLADRMAFKIETDREVDGRWIAEIPTLPGVMAYGKTMRQAVARMKAVATHVIAGSVED